MLPYLLIKIKKFVVQDTFATTLCFVLNSFARVKGNLFRSLNNHNVFLFIYTMKIVVGECYVYVSK
jgi:hypothetical protein